MFGFNEKIRHIRDVLGLSRRALGELLGVPEGKIQKIEMNNQRADHKFLSILSKKTGVDVNWLLDDEGQIVPEFFPGNFHDHAELTKKMSTGGVASEARAAVTSPRDEGTDAVRAETDQVNERLSRLESALARLIDTARAADAATHPKPDPDLLERLACVAATIFRDANVTLPPTSLTAEATIMFNDLVTRVSDVSDPDEIALAMPLVEYNLKRRLKDATADPGAGKHGA